MNTIYNEKTAYNCNYIYKKYLAYLYVYKFRKNNINLNYLLIDYNYTYWFSIYLVVSMIIIFKTFFKYLMFSIYKIYFKNSFKHNFSI